MVLFLTIHALRRIFEYENIRRISEEENVKRREKENVKKK